MTTTTSRLRPELAAALAQLAAKLGRDPQVLADDALSGFVADEEDALAHNDEGIRQADAGEFATEQEVAQSFVTFGSTSRQR